MRSFPRLSWLPRGMARLLPPAGAYLMGAVPFSNLFARRLSGVDLRQVGSGTVSGTGLYRVAGFRALAVSGLLDIAKGSASAAWARVVAEAGVPKGPSEVRTCQKGARWRSPTFMESAAAGLVVAGHNWSPYIDGAGGRGIAPSVGAYLVIAPEGAALALGGLTVGRLARQSGLGTLVGQLILVPLLGRTRGRAGAVAGLCILAPMLVKRILGNGRPLHSDARVYLARLLFDRDQWVGGED
jgi:glycerol-3-phosphate acyltransferase PlsY